MVKPKVDYEEVRKQRIEENRKMLEELNLPMLSYSLKRSSALGSRTPPVKKVKPRVTRSETVPVRRSSRLSDMPAPVYREVSGFEGREMSARRGYSGNRRSLSERVYASDEARAWATEEAEKLEASLEGDHPTFVKPMLQSHVTGGFWLGLPSHFIKSYLPKQDGMVQLINEEGSEWNVIYLARKSGLSGGWKAFAVDMELVDGDALVFQLTNPTTFKVYIIRVKDFGAMNSGDEE